MDRRASDRVVTLRRNRRGYVWLGLAVSLAVALSAVAEPSVPHAVPMGAVAVVNGEPVLRADFDAALRTTLARTGRAQPEIEDTNSALEQAIDEELLIARGLELSLARSDPTARHAILSAVFNTERAVAYARAPSPTELQSLYERERASLVRPGALHLRQLVVRARSRADLTHARERAYRAAQRLRAGEPFDLVALELGEPHEPALPDTFVEVAALREAIGPLTLASAQQLTVGEVSEVLGSDYTLRVLVLIDKRPDVVPSFAEVREQLIQRYRDSAADRAFTAKLAELRARAQIERTNPRP